MNIAERLAGCSQLSELSTDEIGALAASVAILHGDDGHVFIAEGDRGDACYIVLEGAVAVSHEHARGGAPFKKLGPGEMFGIVALIDHGPRSATCRAVGRTTVAQLSAAAFQLLHTGSPSLVLHFRKLVARQLARDARQFNAVLVGAMTEGHPEGAHGASEEFHVTT
jgi:CRP-like cAMP-binding protein